MSMEKKKGQAAIEYMMTYGWAILVIAIVLVAIYVMIQSPIKVQQCNIEPGFLCNDPLPQIHYDETDKTTRINLKLSNKQARGIEISSIVCTTLSPQEVDKDKATENKVNISAGGSTIFMNITCTKDKDNSLNAGLIKGQEFRGHFIVWYNYDNDIDKNLKRTVSASVLGTVQ